MNTKNAVVQFLEDPERERLFREEMLLLDATEILVEIMAQTGKTKADVAKRLGKSKAFMSQVLRGQRNMTLRTLASLAWALDHQLTLSACPASHWTSVVFEGATHSPRKRAQSGGMHAYSVSYFENPEVERDLPSVIPIDGVAA